MRSALRTLLVLHMLVPVCAFAADQKVLIELNSIEGSSDNRCRLNFVIQNKSDIAMETLKLDLVVFGTDGGILQRFLAEMGPARASKTNVRLFQADADCRQLGAILVNDVTACAPGEPGACLDGLGLSSRLQALRFYK